MIAKIEKHSKFSYRWTAGGVRGYSFTRRGAIWASKRQAQSVRNYINAKENTEIIEV